MKKLLLVVGFASVTFGMHLWADRVPRCAGELISLFPNDGYIKFPPRQEIERRIAAVGFSRFARKSYLSRALGQYSCVCILRLEDIIYNEIGLYISWSLTSPDGTIKKHRALEAQMLRECWSTTILPVLLNRTPEDFMLGPDGNGPLSF